MTVGIVLTVLLFIACAVVMFKGGYEVGYINGYRKAKEEQKVISIRKRYPVGW